MKRRETIQDIKAKNLELQKKYKKKIYIYKKKKDIGRLNLKF